MGLGIFDKEVLSALKEGFTNFMNDPAAAMKAQNGGQSPAGAGSTAAAQTQDKDAPKKEVTIPCAACGAENPLKAKFCTSCGAKLVMRLTENVPERWNDFVPQFPCWPEKDREMFLERGEPDENGHPSYIYGISYKGFEKNQLELINHYRNLLRNHGFQMYLQKTFGDMDSRQLYKEIDGVDYHVNTKCSVDYEGGFVRFKFDTNPPKNKRTSGDGPAAQRLQQLGLVPDPNKPAAQPAEAQAEAPAESTDSEA